MTSRRPLTLLRSSVLDRSGNGDRTTLDRYCRTATGAALIEFEIPEGVSGGGIEGVLLVDTGAISGSPVVTPGPRLTHWHVLWVRDEAASTATVTSPQGSFSWPIAPGDTLTIPVQHALETAGDQLALAVFDSADPQRTDIAPTPPTHGDDHFAGYNRCTTYPAPGALALHRWKVTQPLDLGSHHDGDLLLVSLAGDPAVQANGTLLTLRRGQIVHATAGSDPHVYPSGLAYLLVIAPESSERGKTGHGRAPGPAIYSPPVPEYAALSKGQRRDD